MFTKTAIAPRGVATAAANLALAVLFLVFAYSHVHQYLNTPRASLLFIVAVEVLVAILLVIRRDPDRTWHSWKTWLATTAGTAAPLLLRPTDASADVLPGQILQVVGFTVQVGAILSLNRSFGLLPAHRGVKSDGLYRWVRHPLYSAYLLTHLGYLLNNPSLYNVAVIVFATSFQVVRILQEEELLNQYPAYQAYSTCTRWRLVPSLW